MDFSDASRQWFKNKPLNTRGAAYADLDNDGDLELIFNNSKQYSVVLKNNSRELNDTTTNYLRVKLDAGNKFSILHSKVKIYYNDEMQLQELNPCRGFYSSSEHFLHFGLDEVEKVDSLIVTWSNGKQTKLKTIHANQLLEVNYLEDELRAKPAENKPNSPFQIAEIPGLIDYQHRENDYLDFEQNLLLPQLYSRFGPYMAKGDISGNDLEDIIIGGAAGYPTEIYYQISSGVFRNDTTTLAGEKWKEDAGIAIFDINGDGMNDIYVASGGNEKAHGDDFYNHRYYLNKGKGKFQKYILPQINTSASVVRPGKIDNQTFVFVGGRVKAWEYPLPPESYLLVYEDGAFTDGTDKFAAGLKNIGMITDAIWTDFNGDENDDLIVVGEYMSPQFFQYVNGKLVNKTSEIFPVDTLSGFWNSIVAGDFNNDGKQDYVIGNLGLNTRYKASASYPLEIFAGDLDDNGSLDVITACYYEDSVLYPTKQLGPLKKKINGLSKKYYRYSDFGKASVYDVFGMENLESAYHLKAHTTASIYLQNSGDGKFDVKILPVWAQVAPIMDMLVLDFDKDGNQDIVVVGNFYHSEVERGQYTAQKGLILKGDGNGDFNELLPAETGLWADEDCRAIIDVDTDGEKPLIIVGRNNGKLSLYKLTRHEM
ncbi:MAG: FG-GAP-like repeat-containing protein [Chitinophagales bacterium]